METRTEIVFNFLPILVTGGVLLAVILGFNHIIHNEGKLAIVEDTQVFCLSILFKLKPNLLLL